MKVHHGKTRSVRVSGDMGGQIFTDPLRNSFAPAFSSLTGIRH
jgi:hypothetical protein